MSASLYVGLIVLFLLFLWQILSFVFLIVEKPPFFIVQGQLFLVLLFAVGEKGFSLTFVLVLSVVFLVLIHISEVVQLNLSLH